MCRSSSLETGAASADRGREEFSESYARQQQPQQLHHRLTVAWLDSVERESLAAALARDALVVDGALLEELAAPAAERRREAEGVTDTALEEELRGLEKRCSLTEQALDDLRTEHHRLREAAEWCDLQPDGDAEDAAQIHASAAALEEHSRSAREATKRLERVREQRAAAEAALEEARRELVGLGATGIDETDVRRQMEAASHDLRSATTEYQEATKEVARRRAELAEIEDVSNLTEIAAVPRISDGDQLQAMRRALTAKFEPDATSAATVDEDVVERVRSEVRAAQERADEAAYRLSTVRRTIDGFETELIARSNDGDARGSRHDAAVALETQVASVERQLNEAEAATRAEMDDATRAMSRAELALERLRQEMRDRRRKLGEFITLVPATQRPSDEDDLVDHARTISVTLRGLAAAMQDDIDQAQQVYETLRRDNDEKVAELERRRAGRDVVLPEDRTTALQELSHGESRPIVLNDVVTVDDGGALSVADLEGLEITGPLVVLTGDSAVAGWAIELPTEHGRLANAVELWSATGRIATSAPSSQTDHHPEPSSSR